MKNIVKKPYIALITIISMLLGAFPWSPAAYAQVSQTAMLAAGSSHSMTVSTEGKILTWGSNVLGQLGDGTADNRNAPGPVFGPDNTKILNNVTAVAAGNAHSAALAADGRIWTWGLNNTGQLGNGTWSATKLAGPATGITNAIAVAAATGGDHTLAVTADGSLWAWGSNEFGQLGDGSTNVSNIPINVSGLTGAVAAAAGSGHSLAVTVDGAIWAWGDNSAGQLGDGSTTGSSSPVQVSGLTTAVSVAAGGRHSLAVTADGNLWAWGSNEFGQLGDGTTTSASTPVQVSTLTNVIAAAAGLNHSLAVTADGRVWAWGFNGSGQLGNGTSGGNFNSTPVKVAGLNNATAAAAGANHSLALTADGKVWAWGFNGGGQLGVGKSTVLIKTPQPVTGIGGTAPPIEIPSEPVIPETPAPPPGQMGGGTAVTANEFSLSAFIQNNITKNDGGTVNTVTVNEAAALAELNKNTNAGPVVIKVGQAADIVSVRLTNGPLMAALVARKSPLKVETSTGAYILPADRIDFSNLAQQLGANEEDVTINIVISQPKSGQVAAARDAIAAKGLLSLAAPLEYRVEVTAGDTSVEIKNFDTFVTRVINLSKPVDAAAATGVVLNADGTFAPVPTRFVSENGRYSAVINRKTNSIYTVVENRKSFNDVKSHWAKDDINILAARMVVSGMTENLYAPENKVTRAQFATIIVRALGLEPAAAKASFSDVSTSDWFAGAVGAAVEAGIIRGYADGTFKPNAYVTRQEVAAMLFNSLQAAGIDTTLAAGDTGKHLARFTDKDKIGAWAANAVAVAAKNGIISGDRSGAFAPAKNTTRAETAAMIVNLLEKASFI